LDAFDAEYVALHKLAQGQGVHFKRLARELREEAVYPDQRFAKRAGDVLSPR
jgi:hypothetical protein